MNERKDSITGQNNEVVFEVRKMGNNPLIECAVKNPSPSYNRYTPCFFKLRVVMDNITSEQFEEIYKTIKEVFGKLFKNLNFTASINPKSKNIAKTLSFDAGDAIDLEGISIGVLKSIMIGSNKINKRHSTETRKNFRNAFSSPIKTRAEWYRAFMCLDFLPSEDEDVTFFENMFADYRSYNGKSNFVRGSFGLKQNVLKNWKNVFKIAYLGKFGTENVQFNNGISQDSLMKLSGYKIVEYFDKNHSLMNDVHGISHKERRTELWKYFAELDKKFPKDEKFSEEFSI